MTKILLSGCCGKMGRTVTNIVNTRDDCQIVAGVDIVEDSTLGYPVFQSFSVSTKLSLATSKVFIGIPLFVVFRNYHLHCPHTQFTSDK